MADINTLLDTAISSLKEAASKMLLHADEHKDTWADSNVEKLRNGAIEVLQMTFRLEKIKDLV